MSRLTVLVLAIAAALSLFACGEEGGFYDASYVGTRRWVFARESAPSAPPPQGTGILSSGRPFEPVDLTATAAQRLAAEVDRDRMFGLVRQLSSEEVYTRQSWSSPHDDPTHGIGLAFDYLHKVALNIQKINPALQVEWEEFPYPADPHKPANVDKLRNLVLRLPGYLPEGERETVLLVAHFDSICNDTYDTACRAPGANDNASGVAVAMEVVRKISQFARDHFMNKVFANTLEVRIVTGEEQFLVGSYLAAKAALGAEVRFRAVVAMDMVGGWGTGHDLHFGNLPLDGSPYLSKYIEVQRRNGLFGTPSDGVARYFQRVANMFPAAPGFRATNNLRVLGAFGTSDHEAYFDVFGGAVPALLLIDQELLEKWFHQIPHDSFLGPYGDTLDGVHPNKLFYAGQIGTAFAFQMLVTPGAPGACRNDTSIFGQRVKVQIFPQEAVWHGDGERYYCITRKELNAWVEVDEPAWCFKYKGKEEDGGQFDLPAIELPEGDTRDRYMFFVHAAVQACFDGRCELVPSRRVLADLGCTDVPL